MYGKLFLYVSERLAYEIFKFVTCICVSNAINIALLRPIQKKYLWCVGLYIKFHSYIYSITFAYTLFYNQGI